jgi:hypothetical protein
MSLSPSLGAGELSPQEFEAFLRDSLGLAARNSRGGAMLMVPETKEDYVAIM